MPWGRDQQRSGGEGIALFGGTHAAAAAELSSAVAAGSRRPLAQYEMLTLCLDGNLSCVHGCVPIASEPRTSRFEVVLMGANLVRGMHTAIAPWKHEMALPIAVSRCGTLIVAEGASSLPAKLHGLVLLPLPELCTHLSAAVASDCGVSRCRAASTRSRPSTVLLAQPATAIPPAASLQLRQNWEISLRPPLSSWLSRG